MDSLDYSNISYETAFVKVKSGAWTFNQFVAWASEREEAAFDQGYDTGSEDSQM